MKKLNKGFTLIELLVVIAIIGILSSVVLASLNSARNKGADAAIKSNINNARAQAALYYDTNGSAYTGVCASATSGVANMITGATNAGSAVAGCNANANGFAIFAQLKTDTSMYYCVDATGTAKTAATSSLGGGYTCI